MASPGVAQGCAPQKGLTGCFGPFGYGSPVLCFLHQDKLRRKGGVGTQRWSGAFNEERALEESGLL